MLEFCAEKQILPDYTLIQAKDIQDVWDKLAQSNADGLRYVIDIKQSLKNDAFLPAFTNEDELKILQKTSELAKSPENAELLK